MSTRGVIARLTTALPLRFAGRYHHWDSYPTGLGKTLWDLYHGHFDRDLGAMLGVLIDQHPAGWSQICGADFRLVPGFREWNFKGTDLNAGDTEATIPNEPASNEPKSGESNPDRGAEGKAVQDATDEDHIDHDNLPQCYCHGERAEPELLLTEADAAGCGCEWAYAFVPAADPRYHVMLVLSSYTPGGQKMVGFFGQGDPKAFWSIVAIVALHGDEPDWPKLEEGKPLETVSLPDTLGQGGQVTALGNGPSVHPDRGRPGTYVVRTPATDGRATGSHYVGVRKDAAGSRVLYCTCSRIEDAPSPDCRHSLLVRRYLEDRERAATERQGRGLEYTGQRLGNGGYAALAWEAGRPRFLLQEESRYLLAGFPSRGEASRMTLLALAILLDFTGDEVLSLAHCRSFAEFLTHGLTVDAIWWHVSGQQITEFLAGR